MLDRIIGTCHRFKDSLSFGTSAFHLDVNQGGHQGPHGALQVPSSILLGNSASDSALIPRVSIITVMIELLDIWGDIKSVILRRSPKSENHFWQNNSPRAEIQGRLLELELRQFVRYSLCRVEKMLMPL